MHTAHASTPAAHTTSAPIHPSPGTPVEQIAASNTLTAPDQAPALPESAAARAAQVSTAAGETIANPKGKTAALPGSPAAHGRNGGNQGDHLRPYLRP